MDREEMLSLWNNMWEEGNWVPSWPDSLAGLTAQTAAWQTDPPCHSIWAEVVHVTFWRRVTLDQMAGGGSPDAEKVAQEEFAVPTDAGEAAWAATITALQQTQEEIATAIQDPAKDVSRIPYHLIHDAYHLGRITQLRTMLGTAPPF